MEYRRLILLLADRIKTAEKTESRIEEAMNKCRVVRIKI